MYFLLLALHFTSQINRPYMQVNYSFGTITSHCVWSCFTDNFVNYVTCMRVTIMSYLVLFIWTYVGVGYAIY